MTLELMKNQIPTAIVPGRLILLIAICFAFLPTVDGQNKVGINTTEPLGDLDIRGTDDNLDGGELQLATPSQSNFLRFFGGRLDDRNPFLAFHDLDTFHIVTTLPDWSTFTRRLTMLPNGNVGIGIEEPEYKLEVRSVSATDAITIKGYAESTGTGLNIGVHGLAASEYGQGVVGTASHLTGTNYGVYGRTFSEDGYGVYGFASNSESGALGIGIYGISVGQFGNGVSGFANHESGTTVGVRGRVVSTSGKGVHGMSEATSGINFGVYGQAASSSGIGVAGIGKTGVYGSTTMDEGIGVYGRAIGASLNSTIGVMGKSDSNLEGIGVYGEVPYIGTGRGVEGQGYYGVYGRTTDGFGVYGTATNGHGVSGKLDKRTWCIGKLDKRTRCVGILVNLIWCLWSLGMDRRPGNYFLS